MSTSLWPHGLHPSRLPYPWGSPSKNTGVGSHSLLQGIFPTHGSNPGLPHCRQILYQLSHRGSPTSSKETIFERNTSKTFFAVVFFPDWQCSLSSVFWLGEFMLVTSNFSECSCDTERMESHWETRFCTSHVLRRAEPRFVWSCWAPSVSSVIFS